MSVYVDALFVTVSREPRAKFVGARHGHRWCHMLADTPEELHAMAAAIGLKREWFQPDGYGGHYDLTPTRRASAVERGAVQVTRRELGRLLPSLRAAHQKRGAA